MILSNPGLEIDDMQNAIVITDSPNDFLIPRGVTWGVVGESLTVNNTIENVEALLQTPRFSA